MPKKYYVGSVGLLGMFLIMGFYLFSSYQSTQDKEKAIQANWQNIAAQYQKRVEVLTTLEELAPKIPGQNIGEPGRTQALWKVAQEANSYLGMMIVAKIIDREINQLVSGYQKDPTWKSREEFLRLEKQLQETEQKIATDGEQYNELITRYNRQIRVFPADSLAGLFGWSSYPYYQQVK